MRLNLATVEVNVTTESSILSESPRVDILLLRREGPAWTDAQRARLPDGIRDSTAAHILIEFKYTESVTEDGILQAAAYDLFYRQVQGLSRRQTLPVVLSAKTPQKSRLAHWGYEESQRGVFLTELPFVGRVMLLALNRLPAHLNNAIVKLFASLKRERYAGFASLDRELFGDSTDLHAYVLGLRQTFSAKGEFSMAEVITPERCWSTAGEYGSLYSRRGHLRKDLRAFAQMKSYRSLPRRKSWRASIARSVKHCYGGCRMRWGATPIV